MANSIYQINKGINKSVEFRGIRAQYIMYLGGGLVILLVLFAILYIAGVHSFVCIAVVLLLGVGLIGFIYRLNNKYGQYGLLKKMANRRLPSYIKCNSRRVFYLSPNKQGAPVRFQTNIES